MQTTSELEMDYESSASELKFNWKLIKNEQKLNEKLGTNLLQILDDHSNE
jgi:hypothetical protein